MDDVAITELEKIDATRVDGVGSPANGIPILLMKSTAPVEKDWADWDAAHEGGGKASASGDSKASAADAVARAKSTIAAHRAGKKVDAKDLKNAHEVHEAHLAHLAEEKAKGKSTTAAKPKAPAKPAAKPAAAKPAAAKKGMRDCPKCDKAYDADHEGSKCESCGTDLPDAPAAKSEYDEALELVKAIVGRKVDETPDIAGGTAVIAQIAEAVASGSVQPATTLKSRDYSAAERKEMAGDGRALPDGSYPINDEHDLNNAAILARSGHGDVGAAAKHIGKRAKDLGVANPLEDSAEKSEIAQEETDVDTVTQNPGDLTKAVEEAVAKALASAEERITALAGELAKVKATPVPGGPMMTAVAPRRADGADTEAIALKARYFDDMATRVADPSLAADYRTLAAREREKITTE